MHTSKRNLTIKEARLNHMAGGIPTPLYFSLAAFLE
jgi:hypothetical protein